MLGAAPDPVYLPRQEAILAMPTSNSLAFDDVVIDFAGHRLLRGGEARPLEPKAFGVLALLAGQPGRAFTRDEILDAVWGHRHVTPGVLNRIITLLRQALGEDAQNPRLLHTVHGIGYRFDLPAVATPAVLPPVAAIPVEPSPAAAATAPAAADVARTPPRRLHPLFWAIPLAALLALAGWRLWPRATASPSSMQMNTAPGASASIPTLVVLPLKAIGADKGTQVIAEGLSEELIGSLARIDGLRVIASESTRLAAAETSDPAQLAQRLGITHSLEGSLQQDGQALRIRLRLVDARGGALWTKDFDRDAAEVLQLQREVAQQVADSLALKMGLVAGGSAARGGDADFLRRLLAAVVLYRRFDLPVESSSDVAERELRALLRERPDDARVHGTLAEALNMHFFWHPGTPEAVQEEAVREATIAQRLDPSLPDSWVVLATAACRRNDWEHCLSLFREADARGFQAQPVLDRAVLLARLGYLDQAESLAREQLVRDPLNANRNFTLGRILDTRGQHEEAYGYLRAARTGILAYGRWFNAVWRHDLAEALRVAEQEIDASDASYGLLLKPGYIAAARALVDPSLWPQALAASEQFERQTGRLNFVRLLAPDAPAHAAEFIPQLDQNRVNFTSTWDLLLWTKELGYLRRAPAFQDYLRDSGILAYWRTHGFPQQCRPAGTGAVCD